MIDFPRTRDQETSDFEYIRVRLASPEEIRNWSFGEVVKPETINYRHLSLSGTAYSVSASLDL